jgi:sigma-E factor negative regulatory protein RseB
MSVPVSPALRPVRRLGRGLLPALLPAVLAAHLCSSDARADGAEQGEALAWLQRIADAARELSYRGTFVYQHGNVAETSRITHYVDRSGEYEKLETLDGPRREIIRNSSEILTYYAETRVIKRERRTARKLFPALLPEQLAAVTEHYDLQRGGQARVAGYEAQALILRPRDAFRYGHKLWAEINTGLLLKARMFDSEGGTVEQFHFTELTINAPLTRESVKPSFPMPPLDLRRGPLNEATAAAETGWTVREQPAGFRKIMEMKRIKRNGEGYVAHLVFSDGLAAVSVFIEPLPAARVPTEGPSQQGAVNIYTRPMADQLVTVLGETPAITVKQIAESVAPKLR